MSEYTVSDEFKASADEVWKVIADFGGLIDWAPGIESCETVGEGVGAVRTLGMPDGLVMKERLESPFSTGREEVPV